MWSQVGNNVTTQNKAKFLSLPVGITNVRVLDAEPFTRWSHWVPSANRSVTCPGKGCPICEAINVAKQNKIQPQFSRQKKHSVNVINRTTGQVEILEQGNTMFEELFELHTENGDIRGYDIKIKRSGSGTNTKYRVDALEKTPLTEEELKLAEENRIELEEYFKAPTFEQATQIMNGARPEEVFKSTGADEEVELA